MTLIRFEPLRELESFNDRINRFFNEFSGFGSDTNLSFNPKVDIDDDEKHIYVEAEIPGVKKEDLKISLQDNILTISGEKKKESKEGKEGTKHFRSERMYGSFTRSFTLSDEINPDTVDAKFEDGILKISIEKVKAKPKSERLIDIK